MNNSPKNEHLLKIYIKDIHECVSSLEQIWRNVALHHLLCSEWVPSERESKQLMLNITIIHTTPVHQLMSCEVKRLVFVRNKTIINALKLFAAALAKLPSSKHNIVFSREQKSISISCYPFTLKFTKEPFWTVSEVIHFSLEKACNVMDRELKF